MWKLAYTVGKKIAFDTSGLTPEQLESAKNLYGIGGGLLGALGGGAIGKRLGSRVAEAADWDPEIARLVGMGLGAIGGTGIGAAAGRNLAPLIHSEKETPAAPPAAVPEQIEESPTAAPTPAYEPEPEYPVAGFPLLDQIPYESGMGFMQPIYEVTSGDGLTLDLPEDNYFSQSMGLQPGYGEAFDPGWY